MSASTKSPTDIEVAALAEMWSLLRPFSFYERVRMVSYLHSRAIDLKEQASDADVPTSGLRGGGA